MKKYLHEMRFLLPVLGIHAFRDLQKTSTGDQVQVVRRMYRCKDKKGECDAIGYEDNGGFIVREGSIARKIPTASMKQRTGAYNKRKNLIKNGVLVEEDQGYRFTKDKKFQSKEEAALICGGATSGVVWKSTHGKQPVQSSADNQQIKYYCKGREYDATGYKNDGGFVVCKGSVIRKKTKLPAGSAVYKERSRLIRKGILVKEDKGYRFAEDYKFSASSAATASSVGAASSVAASICVGARVSGLNYWKDEEGISLKG